MKKLALGSLLLVALGVIGTSFALTTEVKQESGYGHPLIDHKFRQQKDIPFNSNKRYVFL